MVNINLYMKNFIQILKFSFVALIILTIFIGRKLFFDIFHNTASADAPVVDDGNTDAGDGGGGGGGGDDS